MKPWSVTVRIALLFQRFRWKLPFYPSSRIFPGYPLVLVCEMFQTFATLPRLVVELFQWLLVSPPVRASSTHNIHGIGNLSIIHVTVRKRQIYPVRKPFDLLFPASSVATHIFPPTTSVHFYEFVARTVVVHNVISDNGRRPQNTPFVVKTNRITTLLRFTLGGAA